MKKIAFLIFAIIIGIVFVGCESTKAETIDKNTSVKREVNTETSSMVDEKLIELHIDSVFSSTDYKMCNTEKYNEILKLLDLLQLKESTEAESYRLIVSDKNGNNITEECGYSSYTINLGERECTFKIILEAEVEHTERKCFFSENGIDYEIINIDELRKYIFEMIEYVQKESGPPKFVCQFPKEGLDITLTQSSIA